MGLVALPLERSKTSLLQLRLGNWTPVKQELRDLIAPYIQNTEIPNFLRLKIIENLIQTLLDFPQSTPNLRSLALQYAGNTPRWEPSIDSFRLFRNTGISHVVRHPPLPFLPQTHNPYGAVPPPLPRPSPLGHPFGLFEGGPLS